ncbi:MAG: hypothetical protein RL092_1810 [Bacteroidota bacterium]|jgi:uncharacterized protein
MIMNFEAFYASVYDQVMTDLKTKLSENYLYHDARHTLDVIIESSAIAEREGVEGEDLHALKTAALFHDSGFLFQRKNHEEAGVMYFKKWAEPHLNSNQIETISGLIMATKMPQSPQGLLQQIICDADLDYLGRDDFETIAECLYLEMKACNEIDNHHTWNEIQVKFLSAHQYHTTSSKALRGPKVLDHLNVVRRKAASL